MRSTAQEMREAAGLTIEQAAKKAGVCKAYLRRIELHGKAPCVLASKLAHLYRCSIEVFL
jgi:DNA-binding XRE family transcriptional regulator